MIRDSSLVSESTLLKMNPGQVQPDISLVPSSSSSSHLKMVVTDLDGTLLPVTGRFSQVDLNTLHWLGRQGIIRVIATGRSLFSARHVLVPDFPIDYLIFSSGAGIMEWKKSKLLVTYNLSSADIRQASALLQAHDLDFMLHYPIPENHRFFYYASGDENPDFLRRCQRYQQFARPFDPHFPPLEVACQLVAIDPNQGNASYYQSIRQALSTLKVIRSTSPLDGLSTWIEIFPTTVSKGLASEWIARHHQLQAGNALALGNDYNDLDVLEWAGHSAVVSNAPVELTRRYQTVRSHNDNGFTEAVRRWVGMPPQ